MNKQATVVATCHVQLGSLQAQRVTRASNASNSGSNGCPHYRASFLIPAALHRCQLCTWAHVTLPVLLPEAALNLMGFRVVKVDVRGAMKSCTKQAGFVFILSIHL